MAWWQRQLGETTRGRVVTALRRGERSVEELARLLRLTDNAVRAHLATLLREGVVRIVGVRRDGSVGKPATVYSVAEKGSALFSSAYSPLLSALLAELGQCLPPPQLEAILRSAGRRMAPPVSARATLAERARASAAFLIGLGAEADLVETAEGYEIRGYGCPLSDVVSECPVTCGAVEELLSDVTGTAVREQCDRTGTPRCRFLIPAQAD